MATFSENTWFHTVTCCNCGLQFAMADGFYKKRLEKQDSFYCPAGHGQHFTGTTEAEKLRRQLDAQTARVERAEQRASEADAERRRIARAHRKMRSRVANGVCPCCNRSFENLRRHMQSEHADFGQPQTLKALREAFGMTQSDVAREAGTNVAYVGYFERGKPLPVEARDRLYCWIETQAEAG